METERGQREAGLVLRRKRDGRRIYSASHKRAIVEQCLRPGVSVAGIALAHGINANLVRKWIVKHRRAAAAAAKCSPVAPPVLLPVTVQAEPPRSATRTAAAGGLIVIEVNRARIELVGSVDAEALRTVLRVLGGVRA